VVFLWGRYRQILGLRRDFSEFADRLGGYSDISVHLDPHLIWQATKSYVKRGNGFGLISHKSLPHCRYRLLTAGTAHNLLSSRHYDLVGTREQVGGTSHQRPRRLLRPAATGHAAATLLSVVMNFRRPMWIAM
jgi:hypothetical protein